MQLRREFPTSEQLAAPKTACLADPVGEPKDLRRSILVVDDDRCLRELLSIHLSNAGYLVSTAEDAVVAGRLILKNAPALVIMDAQMPFMTGYELAAVLRTDERTREIPVVFLTSDDNAPDRAARLGAVACLRKPVIADRLLDLVALYVSKLDVEPVQPDG